MNRVLRLIGALIVCGLAALFFLPRLVDWSHYRGVFEEEASRLLGREVRVGGQVKLRLLPVPYVRFETVRIFDAGGNEDRPAFKADGFTIKLSVPPLFRGILEASQVELTRPVLTLVLDDKGGGNWNGLGPRGRSSFVPRNVTLSDVHVERGLVLVRNAKGEELARIEASNAELSAPSLEGPYKVQAMLASANGPRELRLSTAAPESDGTIRFKGVVRALESGASFTLDGQVSEPGGRTRISGDLAAVLPLQQQASGLPSLGESGGAATAGAARSQSDLRAAFKADTQGVEISGLSLAFDSGGQPQFLTGDARFEWRDQQSARIRLESQWLDLDRIVGSQTGGPPLALLTGIVRSLDELMPAASRTQASVALEQATLGGEIVSGFRLMLQKEAGALRLGELKAALPGGSRLEATGTLERRSGELSFDGDVTVRGASLGRFLAWAGKGRALPEVRRDGGFGVRAHVTVGPDSIAARNMTMQLAGNNLTGEASWSGKDHRHLALLIEGSEIDLSPVLNGRPLLEAIRDVLLPSRNEPGRPSQDNTSPQGALTQVVVRMRAGRLVADRTVLRDVIADLTIDRDSLSMPALRFAADGGVTAELRGSVTKLNSPTPKGSISGYVAASDGSGVRRLAELLDLPEGAQPSARRAEALAPVRVAGSLTLGARGLPAFDLSLDGRLASSRLTARALFDELKPAWREQRVDVSLALENAEESPLIAQALPDALAAASDKGVRTPARLSLKSTGIPAKGLATLLTLDSAGLSAEFQGRTSLNDAGFTVSDGQTRFACEDIGRAFVLAGLGRRPGLQGVPVKAVLATTLKDSRLQFDLMNAALGAATLEGRVAVSAAKDKPARIEGLVATGEVDLPRLLDALVVAPAETTKTAPVASSAGSSPWSENALDLSPLAGLDAQVRVETPVLNLASGVGVSDAAIEINSDSGRVGVRLRQARSLGGKLTGDFAFESTAATIGVHGEARLVNAALATASARDNPAASGELGIELELSGSGLSPRALVASLRGKGAIILGPARLNRMSPAGVTAAASAALAVPSEALPAELKRRLADGLASGSLPLGPRRVAFEIADNAVRIEPLKFDTPEGRVSGTTTIDLESMMFDSEWRIESRAPIRPGSRSTLPGVTVVYAGPFSGLGTIEPRMQYDGLERELSVRKMERYVDELERVRRQDEERARQEAERQRSLEQERQRLEDERTKDPRRGQLDIEPAGGIQAQASTTSAPAAAPADNAARSRGPTESGTSKPAKSLQLPDFLRDLNNRSN